MTFDQLSKIANDGLELVTMRINDWFVKGQYATFICRPGSRSLCSYVCIESGKGESVWQFNKEL